MAAPKNEWVENALDLVPGARFLANTGSVLSGKMPTKENFQAGYVGMLPGAAIAKGVGLAAKGIRKAVTPTKAEAAAAAINKLLKQKQVAVNMPRSAFDKMMAMQDPQYLTPLSNGNVAAFGNAGPAVRQTVADSFFQPGSNPISGFLTTKNPKQFTPGANDTANRVARGSTPNYSGYADPGVYARGENLVTLYLNKDASKSAHIFPGDTGALLGDSSVQARHILQGKVAPTSDFVQKYIQGNKGNYIEANVASIKPSDIAKIATTNPDAVMATLKQAGLNIPVKTFKAAVKDPNKLQTLVVKAQQKLAEAAAKRSMPKPVQRTEIPNFGTLPRVEG